MADFMRARLMPGLSLVGLLLLVVAPLHLMPIALVIMPPAAAEPDPARAWVGTPLLMLASLATLGLSIAVGAVTRTWLRRDMPSASSLGLTWAAVAIAGLAVAGPHGPAGLAGRLGTEVPHAAPDIASTGAQMLQLHYLLWGLAVAYVAKLYWDEAVLRVERWLATRSDRSDGRRRRIAG